MLQRPAYLQQSPNTSVLAKAAAGLGTSQPPRISLKDDRFTLIQANGEKHPLVEAMLTMDIIVVGANQGASQIYFAGAYDANNPGAPTCWSDNQIGPSKDAMQPQAETCAVCPHAVWDKVSPNGNKVPACSTHKKIAVLPVPALMKGDTTIYLLSIPPASLKPWRGFVALCDQQGVDPSEMITRISLTDKTLSFDPVDFIPEGAVALVRKTLAGDEPDIVVGNKDKPKQAQIAAPAARPMISTQPEHRVQLEEKAFGRQAEGDPLPPIKHTPTREELEAELARLMAEKNAGQAGVVKKRGRPAQETVIGAGPIPAGTFGKGSLDQGPQPIEQRGPSGGGFIGQANGAFGIQNAPPPDQAVQQMLDKAFGFATK